MASIDDSEDRARRERSPSFPFIPLDKAVERASVVAEAHRKNAARLTVMGETWGYSPSSSGLQQTAAALKSFGLLEDIGRGNERRLQLSDLAWRILMDKRPGAREQAIREAALRPRLIAEYAEKWFPERPKDNHCLSELELDRGFTTAAAKLFLKVFDETMSFATLEDGDTLSASFGEASHVEQQAMQQLPAPRQVAGGADSERSVTQRGRSYGGGSGAHATATAGTAPRATLPLPEGIAALEIPHGLSRKSVDALKAWVNLMVQLTEANADDEPPATLGRPETENDA